MLACVVGCIVVVVRLVRPQDDLNTQQVNLFNRLAPPHASLIRPLIASYYYSTLEYCTTSSYSIVVQRTSSYTHVFKVNHQPNQPSSLRRTKLHELGAGRAWCLVCTKCVEKMCEHRLEKTSARKKPSKRKHSIEKHTPPFPLPDHDPRQTTTTTHQRRVLRAAPIPKRLSVQPNNHTTTHCCAV
jgi:hypothetical protein